jgi:hypothetical protein
MAGMPRFPRWIWIAGALLVVLAADALDHWRPFPPVLRAGKTAKRS